MIQLACFPWSLLPSPFLGALDPLVKRLGWFTGDTRPRRCPSCPAGRTIPLLLLLLSATHTSPASFFYHSLFRSQLAFVDFASQMETHTPCGSLQFTTCAHQRHSVIPPAHLYHVHSVLVVLKLSSCLERLFTKVTPKPFAVLVNGFLVGFQITLG